MRGHLVPAVLARLWDLVVEWFDALEAPSKQLFTLDSAGHPVLFERFDETLRILTTLVLPETYPGD